MSPVYARAICVLASPGLLYLVVLLYLYLRARYKGETLDKHTVGGAMLVCFFMWYSPARFPRHSFLRTATNPT